MKKILSIALASAACAAFADDTVVQGDSDIGVLAVTCSMTNTIIAVPFTELGFSTDICVSNIVKTTGLADGDKIYAYNDGAYECWTLETASGSSAKFWQKAETKYTIGSNGQPVAESGTSPAIQTLGVGKGLWLVRGSNWDGAAFTVYLYGTYSATKTSPVVAGKYNLIANTTSAAVTPTVENATVGDTITVVGNGVPQVYRYATYNGSASRYADFKGKTQWYTTTYSTTSGKTTSTIAAGLPSVESGHGFWYKSAGSSNATVTWGTDAE